MARIMIGTAVCSTGLTAVLAVLCMLYPAAWLLSVAITCGTIAYHFVMRLLVGTAVNGVMHNRADYGRSWYRLHRFEQMLYAKLNVKKWKGKMPTYDPTLFAYPAHTLDEIAQSMCQAEIVHEIIVVCSFLPLLTVPWFGAFWVFLITSALAACFDLAFVMIQRYNRPRVLRMAQRQDKRNTGGAV